jgi:hypothetical protein
LSGGGRAFYAASVLTTLATRLLAAVEVAPEELRRRAAEILERGGYQRELPAAPEPIRPLSLPAGLETLLRYLAWAALVVLAALAVVWLARRLTGGNRDVAVTVRPRAVAPADIPVAAAQALAGEGRYGEAIHALLLETLQALAHAARLPRHYTSREIVARVPLGPVAREALGGLVGAVEVSWFGGVEPGVEEYQGCLERFHAFLGSYRRSA